MLLNPLMILSLMLLPGVCMLATSFVVSLFEGGTAKEGKAKQPLVRADAV